MDCPNSCGASLPVLQFCRSEDGTFTLLPAATSPNMSTEQRYNGWFNFETWAIATWLDNEQETYFLWRNTAREALQKALNEQPELRDDRAKLLSKAVSAFSQRLHEWLEDENPLAGQANAYADLLNAALTEVNHLDIAQHYLDDELVVAALSQWDQEQADENVEDDIEI